MLPEKLKQKLERRDANNSKRELSTFDALIDFTSNDYLGLSQLKKITASAESILTTYKMEKNGATGSRLLSGNYPLLADLEVFLAQFYSQEAALVFNSGYDANLGLLGSVPQRNDLVLYDELVHASIRDGLQLSQAKAHKFRHHDLEDLEKKLIGHAQQPAHHIYVVTESVFSMDGDSPDLSALSVLCQRYGAYLIVDEAHAVGLYKRGMIAALELESKVFARIVTFGKALGCHGAAVLGSAELVSYLVNYARSLVYTTALPPHASALIWAAHRYIEQEGDYHIKLLHSNIAILQECVDSQGLSAYFSGSDSAIQIVHISGNAAAKEAATELQTRGFDVRAILAPTVPEGEERLRICVHSFNTREQIEELVSVLATFAV